MSAGKFEYYEGSDGWRWRLVASNGRNIANGGEAFSSKQAVLNSIRSVLEHCASVNNDDDDCLPAMGAYHRLYHQHGKGTVIVEAED